MNAVLMVHGARVFTVWYADPDAPAHLGMPRAKARMLGECGDAAGWFYYQFWLAGGGERERMRRLWQGRIWARVYWSLRGGWEWISGRKGVHEGCRETRALVVEDVLKSTFGDGWVAPEGLIPRE